MKVLGIKGRSTCGKTTLANLIESRSDDAIQINLDYILNDLKLKLSRGKNIDKNINGDEVIICFQNNPISKAPSFIREFYFFSRSVLVTFLVKKKLKTFKKEGYKLAIIEGVYLPSLLCKFDYVVKVESFMKKRISRRAERDKTYVESDEIRKWDSFDKEINCHRFLDYDEFIFNNDTLANLDKTALKIYKKVMQ